MQPCTKLGANVCQCRSSVGLSFSCSDYHHCMTICIVIMYCVIVIIAICYHTTASTADTDADVDADAVIIICRSDKHSAEAEMM